MRGKFIIFLLFLTAILGIAGFWYYQKNLYSKGSLKLEILGPEQVQLLEEVQYTVKYKNNGNVTLEQARLIFEHPEYSLIEGGEGGRRQEIALEDIYPGQERSQEFRARLVGKKDDIKKAKATLSYRPKNLKAFYESQTSLTTVIHSAPLSFELDLPSKVESGKEMKLSLNYFSSLDFPLSGLRARIDYPSEFEFIDSRPPALEEIEWEIGVLNRAEGGRVEVRGKLSGDINEEKIFRAQLGAWQDNEFVLIKETLRGTKITKPLLSVFQRVNGVEDHKATPGEWLHYEIFFRNIGEDAFRHLFLISRLEGKALDFNATRLESGQFNKDEGSIIWDWREVPQLQFLDEGEEGKVEFWIKLKDITGAGAFTEKNSLVRNRVVISEIKQEFETKISSGIKVSQAGYFEDEVFGNTGPLPPQVGKPTTYTIIWQAQTCCNELKNLKVKAILPSNVKPTGQIFPEDSRLTFDPDSREVIWEIGALAAEQRALADMQSCAFQVALTPTPLQKGKMPSIIGQARITGEDEWIGGIVEGVAPEIDTGLPDDKTVSGQQGVVQ